MSDRFKKMENYKESTPKDIMKTKWQSDGLFADEVRKAHVKGGEVGQIHHGNFSDKKMPDPNRGPSSIRL